MQELKSSKYFNSRPREEVEAASGILNAKYLVFQLTISRRGRRLLLTNQFRCRNYFNSRPHKEVDGEFTMAFNYIDISTHDLTRRSTLLELSWLQAQLFQLTTSQGGRLYILNHTNWNLDFNSRPHKEVDGLRGCLEP